MEVFIQYKYIHLYMHTFISFSHNIHLKKTQTSALIT